MAPYVRMLHHVHDNHPRKTIIRKIEDIVAVVPNFHSHKTMN